MSNSHSEQRTVAFALGGLAGNNAHGAGFLQAALDKGVQPKMISCTSGQILWAYRYLVARSRMSESGQIRKYFEDDLESVQRTGNPNIDLAQVAIFGKEGVFRPAYSEYFTDWLRNSANLLDDLISCRTQMPFAKAFLSMIPARTLVPQFPDNFFYDIAKEFNDANIGIAFNSYNPCEGEEYVYLNQAARDCLASNRSRSRKYDPGHISDHRPYRTYQEIDTDAVRDGLWLYQYGFDQNADKFVDGAYFRGVMLSELTCAETIFSVRPIAHEWKGALPSNYPELEDMKTEVGFNGAYSAERDQIRLINKLLRQGALEKAAAAGYREIDLVEVEIGRQRGYFDYLMESMDVFEEAYREGGKHLNQFLTGLRRSEANHG